MQGKESFHFRIHDRRGPHRAHRAGSYRQSPIVVRVAKDPTPIHTCIQQTQHSSLLRPCIHLDESLKLCAIALHFSVSPRDRSKSASSLSIWACIISTLSVFFARDLRAASVFLARLTATGSSISGILTGGNGPFRFGFTPAIDE